MSSLRILTATYRQSVTEFQHHLMLMYALLISPLISPCRKDTAGTEMVAREGWIKSKKVMEERRGWRHAIWGSWGEDGSRVFLTQSITLTRQR